MPEKLSDASFKWKGESFRVNKKRGKNDMVRLLRSMAKTNLVFVKL